MPFYGAGEYFSKRFALTHSVWYVVLGVLGYAIGSLLWFPALMLRNELLVMDTIWKVLACAITVVLAMFVFHERLTVMQWIGVALVFIGVLLVK